jgi:hypothetical protein
MGAGVHSPVVRDKTEANTVLSQLLQHVNELVADVSQHKICGRTIPLQEGTISLENDEADRTDTAKYKMGVVLITVHWLTINAIASALPAYGFANCIHTNLRLSNSVEEMEQLAESTIKGLFSPIGCPSLLKLNIPKSLSCAHRSVGNALLSCIELIYVE